MNIYVASSWRNKYQPAIVELLRSNGHEVYDFRNPEPDNKGFAWSELDPNWESWTSEQYRAILNNPIAKDGFGLDMNALRLCDACVLVLPCGRSAHLELGWACGNHRFTAVYIPPGEQTEPELMYKMLGAVLITESELVYWCDETNDLINKTTQEKEV